MPPPQPHREDWPLPLRGRWLRRFGIGMVVLTSPLWFCNPFFGMVERYAAAPPVRDASQLRSFFHLPDSSTILSGQIEGSFAFGHNGSVRFTLPNTSTPAQWTATIAKTAFGSLAAQCRKGASHYSGAYGRQRYRVQFLETDSEGRHIYEAEAGWD